MARKLTTGKATKEIGKAAAARTNGNTETIKAIGTAAVKAKEAKESGSHTKERTGTMEETRGYKTLAMTRTRSTHGTRHAKEKPHEINEVNSSNEQKVIEEEEPEPAGESIWNLVENYENMMCQRWKDIGEPVGISTDNLLDAKSDTWVTVPARVSKWRKKYGQTNRCVQMLGTVSEKLDQQINNMCSEFHPLTIDSGAFMNVCPADYGKNCRTIYYDKKKFAYTATGEKVPLFGQRIIPHWLYNSNGERMLSLIVYEVTGVGWPLVSVAKLATSGYNFQFNGELMTIGKQGVFEFTIKQKNGLYRLQNKIAGPEDFNEKERHIIRAKINEIEERIKKGTNKTFGCTPLFSITPSSSSKSSMSSTSALSSAQTKRAVIKGGIALKNRFEVFQ